MSGICRIRYALSAIALSAVFASGPVAGEDFAFLDPLRSSVGVIRLDRLEGYRGAMSFLNENEALIRNVCEAWGYRPAELIPIVFPELLRAAWLPDRAQAGAVSIAYPLLGSGALDFSIGPFQMKPSFAEFLDSAAASASDAGSEAGARRRDERVDRLRSVVGQLGYLARFAGFIQDRHGRALAGMAEEEKIAFMAAAYNGPLDMGSSEIIEMIPRSSFPVIEGGRRKTLPYSFIAVAFWRNGAAIMSSQRGGNR